MECGAAPRERRRVVIVGGDRSGAGRFVRLSSFVGPGGLSALRDKALALEIGIDPVRRLGDRGPVERPGIWLAIEPERWWRDDIAAVAVNTVRESACFNPYATRRVVSEIVVTAASGRFDNDRIRT